MNIVMSNPKKTKIMDADKECIAVAERDPREL